MVDLRKIILLIEDHIDTADFVVTLLSSLDYTVLLAQSRDDALKILGSHGEPDCIVMDWFMPGMTVPDFMDSLRQNYPTVPVLAVSAAPKLAEKAAILKIDRHLTKPYTADDLTTAISACIALRKNRS